MCTHQANLFYAPTLKEEGAFKFALVRPSIRPCVSVRPKTCATHNSKFLRAAIKLYSCIDHDL
jgi:hypothetical protein